MTRGNGQTGALEHPRAADLAGDALHSRALGPIERRHGLTSKLQLTGKRVGRHAGSPRAPEPFDLPQPDRHLVPTGDNLGHHFHNPAPSTTCNSPPRRPQTGIEPRPAPPTNQSEACVQRRSATRNPPCCRSGERQLGRASTHGRRRALTGSTRIARRAGITEAVRPAVASTTHPPTNVAGSAAVTPNNCASM